MVPSRALSSSGSNRASDGGALESNGIIVGNKNEFKEVSAPPIHHRRISDTQWQYTEWCKNCLDDSDFIMYVAVRGLCLECTVLFLRCNHY
jgi:hypothetical protein